MASSPYQDIVLSNLTAGMNDTDSPSALSEDQCVQADNVEFFSANLGERRNGMTSVDLTSSGLTGIGPIVHISQWSPTNDPTDTEWFAIAGTANGSSAIAKRSKPSVGGTWSTITPTDSILTTANGALGLPCLYRIKAQSSQGSTPLNFFTYASAVDRMHVYDGSLFRRAGLDMPSIPSAANASTSGSFSGTRYFRVRFIKLASDNTVLLRSEPSVSVSFSPSGSASGVVVTRPGLLGEGETHWELEASTDDANYYRLGNAYIDATTITDSTTNGLNYPDVGILSETIGDYNLLPSAAYLAADEDRLLLAGHQTDITRMSSIYWTPVFNDPGVGNNERLPLSINNSVNLDNGVGGPITGISNAFNGAWYIFKFSRTYQAVRTGDITRAYDIFMLSPSIGAVPGSVVNAVDERGVPCVYFLDPFMGPCRASANGIHQITGLRGTWARVNIDATSVVSHGIYYPYKQQVHWWVAADGSNIPSLKLVLQVSNSTTGYQNANVRGCWSRATGRIAEAYCSGVLTEPATNASGYTILSSRPFVGLTSTDYLQRCDNGETDNGTAYTATILTRPIIRGLQWKWGVITGTLLASSNSSRNLTISLIRDFGAETSSSITATLTPSGSESESIVALDNLKMAEARAIQVQISD